MGKGGTEYKRRMRQRRKKKLRDKNRPPGGSGRGNGFGRTSVSPGQNPGTQDRKEREKGIRFSRLRAAADYDGECNKCEEYPNKIVSRDTVDAGNQKVVICSGCDHVMKPHPDQNR